MYPNTVDALERLVEEKKLALKYLEKNVLHATDLLRSMQTQSQMFPKTRFYKGNEGVEIMLSEITHDRTDVCMMSDGQHFYDLIDNDFLEKSLATREKYHIKVQMIFPTGFEYFTYTQWTYQQHLSIKLLPEECLLKGGCTIRGHKIAFHCYEHKFLTTTIIENQAISDMMRFLFQSVWKGS